MVNSLRVGLVAHLYLQLFFHKQMLTKNADIANTVCGGASDMKMHFQKKFGRELEGKKLRWRGREGGSIEERERGQKDGKKGGKDVYLLTRSLFGPKIGGTFFPHNLRLKTWF